MDESRGKAGQNGLELRTRAHDPAGTIRMEVAGELDLRASGRLVRSIEPFLQRRMPVVVDLTEVSFIDSAGLLELWRLRESLAGVGIELVVAADPSHMRVFRLAGVEDRFRFGSDVS